MKKESVLDLVSPEVLVDKWTGSMLVEELKLISLDGVMGAKRLERTNDMLVIWTAWAIIWRNAGGVVSLQSEISQILVDARISDKFRSRWYVLINLELRNAKILIMR